MDKQADPKESSKISEDNGEVSLLIESVRGSDQRFKGKFDDYYVAYKPITLSCISLKFIEMKFIYCFL